MSSWKGTFSNALSDHKFLVSHIWRLCIWEKPFFPAITFFGLTIFFWILSMFKLSSLSSIAFVGLIAIGIDYGGPLIYRSLEDAWGSPSESNFDSFCAYLAIVPMKINQALDALDDLKRRQKILFSGALAATFVVFILIGRINNTYLCYLFLEVLFLAPGALKAVGMSVDDFGGSGGSGGSIGTSSFSSSPPGGGFGSTSPPSPPPSPPPLLSSPPFPPSVSPEKIASLTNRNSLTKIGDGPKDPMTPGGNKSDDD